jgi:predicted protein tyrosine phosphatase
MIIVCGLQDAAAQAAKHEVSHAISILSPPVAFPVFDGVADDKHLRLDFHDVAAVTPGLSAPAESDMQSILGFLRQWDQSSPLLIHCWAGISRSTASAYIATCLLQPERDERELAHALRLASPTATPNPMLVALADDALGRDGRMRRAIADIGRGEDAYGGTPFTLAI